jgi:hypothetical protein
MASKHCVADKETAAGENKGENALSTLSRRRINNGRVTSPPKVFSGKKRVAAQAVKVKREAVTAIATAAKATTATTIAPADREKLKGEGT